MVQANPPAPKPRPKAPRFWSNWLPWGVAAAACVMAVASWWMPRGPAQDSATSGDGQKTAPEVTAMLVDEAGAVFALPRQPGEVRFDPGAYELLSGTVHLRYVNGADLVVEGPAWFEIRDAFRTHLAAGRVRAIVPPTARGFTVVTRGVVYEDVGTEFGLSVDGATGASQMHVFDGHVNLRRGDVGGPLLRRAFAGDSVGFRDGQVVEVPEMGLADFPSPGAIGHQCWVGHPVPTGKWVHVVSVLSLPQRRHVIYVNGLPVLESELAEGKVLLQPGPCRLGNWLGDGCAWAQSPRALRGLVDELSLWNRALSATEVTALTESGRPSLLWSRENPPLMEPMPRL